MDWNFVSTMSWLSITLCLFLLMWLSLLGVVVFPIVLGLAIYATYKHAHSIKKKVGKVCFAWDELSVVGVMWFGMTTVMGFALWVAIIIDVVGVI